jgi:trehalose 6-phosphate phosphatase
MRPLTGLLTDRSALFLDFDGTLAELAPRPDAVVVPHDLPALLMRLHDRLGGALAIVTGRAQADLECLLGPLSLPAAFEHGAVRQTAAGESALPTPVSLHAALAAAEGLAAQHSGLLVERKRTSLALHYRLAPELEALCLSTLADAVRGDPALQLLRGKAVVEVKSARVSKGEAIRAFLQEAPFAGRSPLFAGDDVTDEAGFEVVQQFGGAGIKVGAGDSVALHRLPDPPALRTWLQSAPFLLHTP